MEHAPHFLALVAASSLLYTAGMVLNDLFDYEIDLAERPTRPLPSGRIDRSWAQRLGWSMLVAGVAFGWLVGPRSGIIATLLALTVILYNSAAKKTGFGPLAMGGCRTLNVLLGMSSAFAGPIFAGYAVDQWFVAIGIGVYVMGITWFARSEANSSPRGMLILGLIVMGLGICVLAAFPGFSSSLMLRDPLVWPTLLVLLMVSVVRRCVVAISDPSPTHVQQAVKHSIFTLIVLDAGVVLAVHGPIPALGVLALLIPTVVLGKWVYST